MAQSVCPVWIGYLLASPIRRLFENPDKILGSFLKPNMTVLDIGCAMGYFTIAAAKLVGPGGKVFAVDLQPKMINSLRRRAIKAKLANRIEPILCNQTNLNINDLIGQIDFALAFYVIHEVPDAPKLFEQIYRTVKSGGRFFMAEPRGHVSTDDFKLTVDLAQKAGFEFIEKPDIKRARTALFTKK